MSTSTVGVHTTVRIRGMSDYQSCWHEMVKSNNSHAQLDWHGPLVQSSDYRLAGWFFI